MIALSATVREEKGKKLNALREQGMLPAVVYGAKVESIAVSVDAKEFLKILRESGETGLITLKGLEEEYEVLIHDVVVDTIKGHPIHADFLAVERGKEIEVMVPIEFIGEAPAEKAGAQLVKALHEVEVKTTPGKIPSHFDVDLSALVEVGDRIQVKDITVPEGVEILNDLEDALVLTQEQIEEVEEETASVDMDAVEVEQKGKEEDGGGSPEEKKEEG